MLKLAVFLFLAILQISIQEEICVEKDVEKLCKDLTKEELELLKAPTYTDFFGTEIGKVEHQHLISKKKPLGGASILIFR